MIEGICPKCNRRYYGWALLRPGDRHCEKVRRMAGNHRRRQKTPNSVTNDKLEMRELTEFTFLVRRLELHCSACLDSSKTIFVPDAVDSPV